MRWRTSARWSAARACSTCRRRITTAWTSARGCWSRSGRQVPAAARIARDPPGSCRGLDPGYASGVARVARARNPGLDDFRRCDNLMKLVGILLAAGRGERFGGDKLLAPLPGESTVGATSLPSATCAQHSMNLVIAVVRPGDSRRLSSCRVARNRRARHRMRELDRGHGCKPRVRRSRKRRCRPAGSSHSPTCPGSTLRRLRRSPQRSERGASVAAPISQRDARAPGRRFAKFLWRACGAVRR